MRRFFLRSRNALWPGRGDGDLARELDAHRAMLEGEYVRRGMSADEARFAARRALGSTALVADRHRDARSFIWIEDLRRDFAHGLRGLRRSPGFAALAIVALGLGIGVNTTFFTIVNAICLRGLPTHSPERVLYISVRDAHGQTTGLSWAEFDELRARATTLGQLAGYTMTVAAVAGDGQPAARVLGAFISAGAFELLGVNPVVGRAFRSDEDRPGSAPVAVLGNDVWHSRFGADPEIVGRSIRVNGLPTTVVGVMPRGFMFPSNADLWRPMANLPPAVRDSRTERRLAVFGRLASGATVDRARAELATIDLDVAAGSAADRHRARLEAVPINDQVNPSVWQRAWLAFITAGALVLLVACANVANLLLMRGAARGREIAIRTSIGATRWRVIRQLLVESATLSALAWVVGLGLAWIGLRGLSGLLPPEALPYWMTFTIDARVLGVTTAVCVGCVFICGLPAAVHLSRVDTMGAIAAESQASAVRPARRWISALLAAEVAVTLVLVLTAVNGVRVGIEMNRREFQVDPASLVTAWVTLPADAYPTAESRQRFIDRLEERAAPGAMAVATALPYGGALQQPLAIEGRAQPERAPLVSAVSVSDSYFEVLHIPLIRGRAFAALDGRSGSEAAIVNERFARLFLDGAEPLDARIRLGGPASPWLRVVGVATTVRQQPFGADADPVVYVPFRAAPPQTMAIVVRSPGSIEGPVARLRSDITQLNPDLPLYRVMTFEQAARSARWNVRQGNILVQSIAVVALVLALIGLYAVTGHTVERWRRELALRVALGAARIEVASLVLRRVLVQLGIGLGLGVICATLFDRLFNEPSAFSRMTDPAALVIVLCSIVALAVAACLAPIHRATRVDPIAALRQD